MFNSNRLGVTLILLLSRVYSGLAANNLNIAKPGSGFGVVSSGDANINCGADCTGSFTPGSAVGHLKFSQILS